MIKKRTLLLCWLALAPLFVAAEGDERYVFFLHNKFIEDHQLDEEHPSYGRAQYKEIVDAFKQSGFTVVSEKRKPDTDITSYARVVVAQINVLIEQGVPAENITVVGTSKGGLIAQYVSSFADSSSLNFVFIGSSFQGFSEQFKDVNLCGNILAINERSDAGSVSLESRMENSSCGNANFQNIELNTGKAHGFLFELMNEWFMPTTNWANGNYE